MNIKLKLFSHLKYRLGKELLMVEVSDQINVREVRSKIQMLGGAKISSIPFRIAVNGNFVGDDYVIKETDDIALIPPVQGG